MIVAVPTAAKVAWSFLGRHWKLIAFGIWSGLLIAQIVQLKLRLGAEQVRTAELRTDAARCNATLQNERQAVRDKTAVAKAQDAAHAATVEQGQTKIQMEKNDAIRDRIDRAGAALRLRPPATPAADPGGSRGAAVPGVPAAAGGADGAGGEAVVPADDLRICATNTIKAEGWQEWWTSVQAIPR